MSTSQTVKISSGKILDYTIKKDGFKTIHGSKLINSNDTINIDMIADTETTYYFGQRIGGIATVVGLFHDTKNNKKYMFAILDSTYYTKTAWTTGLYGTDTGLPNYSSDPTRSYLESATYNTDYILNNYSGNLEAFQHCRNAGNLTFNGQLYQFQLPNADEVQRIYDNRAKLYELDPTTSSNTSYNLANWNFNGSSYLWSSNEYNSDYSWELNSDGSWNGNTKNTTYGVVPVLEIELS